MNGKIGDFLLSMGIKVYHKMEKLTEKELKAQENYFLKLDIATKKENKKIAYCWNCRVNRFRQDNYYKRNGSIDWRDGCDRRRYSYSIAQRRRKI